MRVITGLYSARFVLSGLMSDKDAKPLRTKTKGLKWSPEEKVKIERAAKLVGQTFSGFVRNAALVEAEYVIEHGTLPRRAERGN